MAETKNQTAAKNNARPRINLIILLFLLISGSCGLVYEILWLKMLNLVIGSTVFAAATVLSAFMGGLALGSYLAGRFGRKITNPIRIYALLEGGIGLYALALPVLIAGSEPLFRYIYQEFGPSYYAFGLLRFFVCGSLLLIPTALMGATLPVLSRWAVDDSATLGRNIGLLYGVNTFGAVLGCSLAGFVLIPALGITWTVYGAAMLNLAVCIAALGLAKNSALKEPADAGTARIGTGKSHSGMQESKANQDISDAIPEDPPPAARVVMAAIGLSGMAALIYQTSWTRVIALSIGSSVYAFSLIVAAFISGLALGSLLAAAFIDRIRNLPVCLALLQAAIGLTALALVPALGRLPVILAESVFTSSNSFANIHLAGFAVIFVLILIPTLMMGAALPLAVKICTRDAGQVARFFGSVYAVNTLGAILGSLTAGFVLVPRLGTQTSILIAVGLNMAAAGAILVRSPGFSRPKLGAGALAVAGVALLVWLPSPRWDGAILASAPYLYSEEYRATAADEGRDIGSAMKAGRQLIYFKESLHALVSVEKTSQGDLVLGINGKADASARGADVPTQLMLGHLPLLLHPNAQDVLIIGLGSGMTLGAVERHPVKAVDVIEIEAAVVEASHHFRKFAGNPLDDGRAKLILADGRNHLALTGRQYDVIVSEPSNPWIAGMANLFTREFFESARRRLHDNGLMCQWVHAYAMSAADFKVIAQTFQTVFPNALLWESSFGRDYLLIGLPQDWHIESRALIGRLTDERLGSHLEKMNVRGPAAFLNKLILTREALGAYCKGSALHTDNNALLEYSAPKALFRERSTILMEELYQHRSTPGDILGSLKWAGIDPKIEDSLSAMRRGKHEVLQGFVQRNLNGITKDTVRQFERALAINPEDYDGTFMLAKAYYDIAAAYENARRPAEAIPAYQKCVGAIENFMGGESKLLGDHFELDVIYAAANLQLGTRALNADRLEQAAAALKKSISGEVHFSGAHNNLGLVYERRGKHDAAAQHYRRAIELDPNLASAHMNLGNVLLKQNKHGAAIQSYRRVQQLKPDYAIANFQMGVAYYQQKQWRKAEKEWKHALALKPNLKQARRGLKAVRRKMKTR